jgi:hypothetical protein
MGVNSRGLYLFYGVCHAFSTFSNGTKCENKHPQSEPCAAPTSDWLVASCAERAPLGMVVSLAVGQPLVVEERAAVERLPAVLQNTKNTCVRIYTSHMHSQTRIRQINIPEE